MPVRMVDGEALWTSSKLKKVQPATYRLHYANWLPLAEANGVFEVDFDIIRARVYPIIDPHFSAEDVRKVYEEFVRVGLLVSFSNADKEYAYFLGIHKPGRLPSDKHLKRYKNLPPDPPSGIIRDESRASPRGFGLDWSGMDRVGKGLDSPTALTNYADKVS